MRPFFFGFFLAAFLWAVAFMFGVLALSVAHADSFCPAGFKTQDFTDFATTKPMFTISLDDRENSCDGKTGIAFDTTGLFVSIRADVSPTVTWFRVADSTIQNIGTIGLYVTPTVGKMRFGEVDPLKQPGVYQLQFARSFFYQSNSKTVDICVGGVTGIPFVTCEKIYLNQSHCGSGGCS